MYVRVSYLVCGISYLYFDVPGEGNVQPINALYGSRLSPLTPTINVLLANVRFRSYVVGFLLLLRGTIVNRTYGIHKKLYI